MINCAFLTFLLLTCPIFSQSQSSNQSHIKNIISDWTGPHGGVPPFDKIEADLFEPAFKFATRELIKEVEAIANQDAKPSFENTILALEKTGKSLDNLSPLFFTMTANRNSPEYQQLSGIILPLLSGVADQIYFNERLFGRIRAIHQSREKGGFDDQKHRLTELIYDEFVRRGARLDLDQKKRLGEINQELAKLFADFSNKVQADEDAWTLLQEDDLDGLPKSMIDSYRAAAKKRNLKGYAVVNTRSAVDPFLTFSDLRHLRERVWRAFIMRGDNPNQNNTHSLIERIIKLRSQRAQLLDYPSHAHWRMSDTMAKEPHHAIGLLDRVWPAAVARVREEVDDMQELANQEKEGITIEPWDYRYYMEKVRQARYDLDQSEFKKYFTLENMIEASYYMAEHLYGYSFTEITGEVPVFHPDVRVFRVNQKADDALVGLLYRDDFARQYKRSGAWQSTYRTQHKLDGQVNAIVSNNNNFVKGKEGDPVLISLDDAVTLFHEFGHAIHGLANDTTYPGLSNTPRDFVEFPSQVHENWVLTREVLDQFARHYQTNEKMPQSLIDKMKKAETFNQGFATVEYMASAFIDMRIHMAGEEIDPARFERETLSAIGMPKEIVLRHRLPHFLHLFSSDSYSAGYYSYLWSDVMAADAWQAFEETGDFWNKGVAKKFFDLILANGNAIDRAEAYRQFRGRDPKVEALLKNRGFPISN